MQTVEARADASPGPALHGVWAAATTAVSADLTIDVTRSVAHARWLLDNGCHGVVVFGSTGEANSFSAGERMDYLEQILDAGVPAERLMIGTGCCALTDTVGLTAHAAGLGCRRVLMLPPFYYKGVSDAGLERSFSEVFERVGDPGLRVVFYHFPRLSAIPISIDLMAALYKRYPDTVAGVKDSSGDPAHAAALLENFPALAIMPGSERVLLERLEQGAAGCISATVNVNSAHTRRVYDSWREGAGRATAEQAAAAAVREAIEAYPLVPALKRVIAHQSGDEGWLAMRPPLEPLADIDAERLIATLDALSFRMGD